MLAVAIGIAGCGKSTYGAMQHSGEVVCLDDFRALASGDPSNQDATADAVPAHDLIVGARLRRRLTTYVDATNTHAWCRGKFVSMARAHEMPPHAVLFTTSVQQSLLFQGRRARQVEEPVLRKMYDEIAPLIGDPGLLLAEGFAAVTVVLPVSLSGLT